MSGIMEKLKEIQRASSQKKVTNDQQAEQKIESAQSEIKKEWSKLNSFFQKMLLIIKQKIENRFKNNFKHKLKKKLIIVGLGIAVLTGITIYMKVLHDVQKIKQQEYISQVYLMGDVTSEELYNIGYKFFKEKQYQKAINSWTTLLKQDASSDAKVYLALAYKNLNDDKQASQLLDEVIETRPNHLLALHNRAILYLEEGDPMQALVKIVAIDEVEQESYPQVYITTGITYEKIGDWSKAKEFYEKFLESSDEKSLDLQLNDKEKKDQIEERSKLKIALKKRLKRIRGLATHQERSDD